MRHLPVSKVASLLLVLLLAVLPAAPAKADEVGDSFFAEIAGYFEALFTHWLGDSPQNAPSALGYSFPPHGVTGDEPTLGESYPPGGSPENAPSALGESYPPSGVTGDEPTLGYSFPPGGDALTEEPPVDPELGYSFPPNG